MARVDGRAEAFLIGVLHMGHRHTQYRGRHHGCSDGDEHDDGVGGSGENAELQPHGGHDQLHDSPRVQAGTEAMASIISTAGAITESATVRIEASLPGSTCPHVPMTIPATNAPNTASSPMAWVTAAPSTMITTAYVVIGPSPSAPLAIRITAPTAGRLSRVTMARNTTSRPIWRPMVAACRPFVATAATIESMSQPMVSST